MTLLMQEREVFPKLITDSESLTFSDSCVKSDIADIIKRIYSPRPLVHCNKTIESAAESRDSIGDNITISRTREKQVKRFGFYFEPVTGNFAKTIVDSSTTSGSVSMPIVRYKPKRLRNVCECCKRKIPYRDHETRVKRACRDCGFCRRNEWSEVGNRPTAADLVEEETRWERSSKMKVSSCDIVQIHPASSFKMLEEIQEVPSNLERTRSSTHLPTKHSGNVLKRNKTRILVGGSSVLDPQVAPDLAADKEITKTQQSTRTTKRATKRTNHRDKKEQFRNDSFFQRILSNLFGKNFTSNIRNEDLRPSFRKAEYLYPSTKPSKTSFGVKKETKKQKNNKLSGNTGRGRSSLTENPKIDGVSRSWPIEEIGKSADINSEENYVIGQTATSEESTNLRRVIVHSCPELSNKNTKHEIDKNTSVEDENRRDLLMCDKDVESGLSDKYQRNERISAKPHEKDQVAYKGLRIEKDVSWAYEFWGGIFGTCHSVVSFFTAFILHLLTFVLQSLIQPLVFGTVRVSSDHFFKPCLSTAFESVIQPVCTLIERLAFSLRDICFPVGQCFGEYCKEISHVCKACRIVEINKNYQFSKNPINP